MIATHMTVMYGSMPITQTLWVTFLTYTATVFFRLLCLMLYCDLEYLLFRGLAIPTSMHFDHSTVPILYTI